MPVKGKLPIEIPDFSVYNMIVGEKMYLHADRVIVTRKAVFVHTLSLVCPIDEVDDEMSEFIIVERVGSGLTSEDFILDMSYLAGYYFILESLAFYIDFMREKEEYIVFKDFELDESVPVVEEGSELERLQKKLDEAKDKEDYAAAIKYRDQIAELKKQKSKK
jgi:hypothetical protein